METTTHPMALHCVVVTPEKALLDVVCDFIALPMYDGELGVLPGRLPLIGRLGFGELRTQIAGKLYRYYVDGGFVQIKNNVVTVLTSKAIKAEEINTTVAEGVLKDAQKPVADAAAQETRAKAQARARAQIRVARQAAERPTLTLDGV